MENMKPVICLLIMMIAAVGCSVNPTVKSKEIRITVMDKKTKLPVDSAQVSFITIVDGKDVYPEVKYTDTRGRCCFSITHNPSAQYQVNTTKKGLLSYFDADYIKLIRSYAIIDEKTDNNIVLYLTSDSLNHINYWKKITVRYAINTLIDLLKSNAYPDRSRFPLLVWSDIPELLTIGTSRTLITNYPISLLSSSYAKECYLGIISLWFIESARITELKKAYDPMEKFPSLTPSLRYIDKPELTPDNDALIDKAYEAYKTWWDKVKTMDKQQGCRINPLENTGLEWR
jgi:hypothetical protein